MSDFAVSASIGAVDRITGVMNKINSAFGKLGGSAEKGFEKAEKSQSKFMEAFKAQFAALQVNKLVDKGFEALKSVPEAIDAFVSKGNEIAHTSQIIGTTAEQFQRLAYAAHMQDISQEDVVTSMQKLNNNLGQLKVNTGAMYTTLLRINPQLAKQLMSAKDSHAAMLDLADGLKATTNAQDRAAIAQAAFGRSGQVMLPLLLEGASGIEKLEGEASKYGDVLSNQMIDQTLKADDTLKKIKGTLANIKDQVLGALLTKLQPIIETVQEWVTANKDLISEKIKDFISGIVDTATKLAPVLKIVIEGISWLVGHFDAILIGYAAFTAAQIALNIAMDANPIGLITLGIEMLIAVAILVVEHWNQITAAVKSSYEWFTNLYDKSMLLRNALFFLASPIWLVVNAIRALVDLISGKGIAESLSHFIPPWMQSIFAGGKAIFGGGANSSATTEAPNAHVAGPTVNLGVNVDNSRAPGVTSNVRMAPDMTGNQGAQYAGGL